MGSLPMPTSVKSPAPFSLLSQEAVARLRKQATNPPKPHPNRVRCELCEGGRQINGNTIKRTLIKRFVGTSVGLFVFVVAALHFVPLSFSRNRCRGPRASLRLLCIAKDERTNFRTEHFVIGDERRKFIPESVVELFVPVRPHAGIVYQRHVRSSRISHPEEIFNRNRLKLRRNTKNFAFRARRSGPASLDSMYCTTNRQLFTRKMLRMR